MQEIVGSDAIEEYANRLLVLNELSPNGLLAKGLYLYKTKNFVAARDYLNRGRCSNLPFLDHKKDIKINVDLL